MKSLSLCVASILMLNGCAISRADHFYTLSTQPRQVAAPQTAFTRQVSLHVTLPSLVDRGELVLTSHDQVMILEHERWASPLPDQLLSTLGQDLEARRSTLVVTNRSLEQSTLPISKISVEVVRITAERRDKVVMETRWRLVDSSTGNATVGRDTFTAPMASADYAQIAVALSDCVGQLADTMLASLPLG